MDYRCNMIAAQIKIAGNLFGSKQRWFRRRQAILRSRRAIVLNLQPFALPLLGSIIAHLLRLAILKLGLASARSTGEDIPLFQMLASTVFGNYNTPRLKR